MIDFTGKTIMIAGAGAGIGRAMAETFAAAGGQIVGAEIDPARAADLRAALAHLGDRALVIEADMAVRGGVERAMAEATARFGGIDVLIANLGDFLGLAKPFEAFSDGEIDALYSINLKSAFLLAQAGIPHLRAGGSMICVSSIEAFRGIPMCTAYSAFKHAITGFVRSLALELAPRGIRVNAIAPETTETPQVRVGDMIAPEHRDHIARWIPLGRFGQPRDAAGAALFLASDLAAWVTGTTINLDGGALAAAGWYRDPKGFWTNVPVVTGNGFNF